MGLWEGMRSGGSQGLVLFFGTTEGQSKMAAIYWPGMGPHQNLALLNLTVDL